MVSIASPQVPHDAHFGEEGVTAAVFHCETKHTHSHTQKKLEAPDLLLVNGK